MELLNETIPANTASDPIATVANTMVSLETNARIKIEGESGADIGICEPDEAISFIATSSEITITTFDVAAAVIINGEGA